MSEQNVTFIQCERTPLESGMYTITVKQEVTLPEDDSQIKESYSLSKQFVVAGERFTIDTSDICTFPPNLANGEYYGVLPHIVFNRKTLPWERTAAVNVPKDKLKADPIPWLAVLLFNEDEALKFTMFPANNLIENNETSNDKKRMQTVKDLIKKDEIITVTGSDETSKGTLPENYLSYPGINPLNYGESPEDNCNVIDIPVELFNRIAPSIEDLPYLAHVREVDTTYSIDHTEASIKYSIVLSNRVAIDKGKSYAFLVSLEGMGDYLPVPDGTASTKIPPGIEFIRLITYYNWSFVANDMGETFKNIAESLNKSDGKQTISSLQYPFEGTPPTSTEVKTALEHQSTFNLTDEDAWVLLRNNFTMGYLPLKHHLRHGGQTISWYRGPLVPYPVNENIDLPISCPDAASRYDPQTGLFDISYSAAWQLGQLLALQSTGYSTALYNWKRSVAKDEVIKAEMDTIAGKINEDSILESFLPKHALAMKKSDKSEEPPEVIVDWIAKLRLLNGVPFQYLVPDESMLPPESLRFFYLDSNWIDALIDGAFSIGRSATNTASESTNMTAVMSVTKTWKTGVENDLKLLELVKPKSLSAAKKLRKNPGPLTLMGDGINLQIDEKNITGFLMRSQLVSGWPRLNVKGYSDAGEKVEIPILKMNKLSEDVLLCLFQGVIDVIALCEPPEQLHSGVEGSSGQYTTTLRRVNGLEPGKQLGTTAPVPCRSDGQTLMIKETAENICKKLNDDFQQNVSSFTSAELSLEMVKGVTEVEFQRNGEGSKR